MTSVDEFPNTNPCEKWDPWCIDAFFDLKLTPANGTELTLDSSWNTTSVDLTPAVKAAETITHLELTPTALQYNREDYGRDGAENGGVDCVNGDDLSHIISMKYLRDVDQTTPPLSGDVYMYDGTQFNPYDLQTFVNTTNQAIQELTNAVNNLQGQITSINNQLSTLQQQLSQVLDTIKRPDGIPTDTVLAWGNINDTYNTSPTTKGIYTHNPANNVIGDQRFQ